MNTTYRFFLILTILVTLTVTAACFGGDESEPEVVVTRTPHPTFTPTPLQPAAPPTVAAPAPNTGGPVEQQQQPATEEKPIAVVNDELVNIRRGPGTDQEILATVGRGEQYEVVGQNPEGDWWQVCCINGEPGWVFYAYVDTSGPVDQLAAAAPTNTPPPPPTNTPVPAAPAAPAAPAQPAAPEQPAAPTDTPAPTATPAPAFPFNLVASEQFPEGNNLVRVFLYVYQGDQALPGYSISVKKDGAGMPVNATSSENAGFTWPVANPRQRFQNMKVEFTGVQAASVWEVQLVDGSGAPAGPPATFTIGGTDINRELYVRYEKP